MANLSNAFIYFLLPTDMASARPDDEIHPVIVEANEPGYRPLNYTWKKKYAQEACDGKNKAMGLTPAQTEAILASSMFFKNGVRYPQNLPNFEKHCTQWESERKG